MSLLPTDNPSLCIPSHPSKLLWSTDGHWRSAHSKTSGTPTEACTFLFRPHPSHGTAKRCLHVQWQGGSSRTGDYKLSRNRSKTKFFHSFALWSLPEASACPVTNCLAFISNMGPNVLLAWCFPLPSSNSYVTLLLNGVLLLFFTCYVVLTAFSSQSIYL